MKAVHALSLQQSAPAELLGPSEDESEIVQASDVDRAAYYSAIYYDDGNHLLWRLVRRLIWCTSVLLVACFAASLIALSLPGPAQPALKASPPEEVISRPSHAPSELAGLGVPEDALDVLFLADDHSRVAFFIPAREIASRAASTAGHLAAAGQGPGARLAAVATLEAELTTALETASTAIESSAAPVGGMLEIRLATVATLEAEPPTGLEIVSRAAEPSAAIVGEMPEVRLAAVVTLEAEPPTVLEIASTGAQLSAAH